MSKTGPHITTKSTEDIVCTLRGRIFSGDLVPGKRLIETDLAEELGVGRGRVREAFRVLVGEGHLAALSNRGVVVRRYTRAELLDMGRAREVLESLAARLAAEKTMTSDQRDRLQQAQDCMDAAEKARDLKTYSHENRAYHALIETIADNKHLTDLIERVRVPNLGLRLPQLFAVDQLRESNDGHRFVTYSILASAPDVAEAAMRNHIRTGNAHMASLSDDVFE